jgi:hypothetical protein
VNLGTFRLSVSGLTASDLKENEWVKTYSSVVGVFDGNELNALRALRKYQKIIRKLLPKEMR